MLRCMFLSLHLQVDLRAVRASMIESTYCDIDRVLSKKAVERIQVCDFMTFMLLLTSTLIKIDVSFVWEHEEEECITSMSKCAVSTEIASFWNSTHVEISLSITFFKTLYLKFFFIRCILIIMYASIRQTFQLWFSTNTIWTVQLTFLFFILRLNVIVSSLRLLSSWH